MIRHFCTMALEHILDLLHFDATYVKLLMYSLYLVPPVQRKPAWPPGFH